MVLLHDPATTQSLTFNTVPQFGELDDADPVSAFEEPSRRLGEFYYNRPKLERA
jgi:hypothetical protein